MVAARRAMSTRTYPIVLAHGIARFDVVLRRLLDDEDRLQDSTHYFRRIRSTLVDQRFQAHHASVSWAASVTTRALELKREVEKVLAEERCEKVHIIAHSMGGLDARHMLFEHRDARIHEKVASVTTIGTPHLGTAFADWGLRHADTVLKILNTLGIETLDGFRDLTTRACRAFNEEAEAFEAEHLIPFQTIAGVQEFPFIFEPLKPSWAIIFPEEGPNDGLVSLESARWKDDYFQRQVDADHLNQIGWWDPNDRRRLGGGGSTKQELETRIRNLYVQIAEGLAEKFPVP